MDWKNLVIAIAGNPIGAIAVGLVLWGLNLLVGHSIMMGIVAVAAVGLITAGIIAWRKRS